MSGPGDPAGKAGKVGFRPDIEGLRAIAILTVLAYHAGPAGAWRVRGRRRLLRDLRLPHHRAAGRRARPHWLHLVDPVRGQADPAPAAGGRARAGAHVGGLVVRGARSAPPRHRRRHRGGGRSTSSTGCSPVARPTTSRPTCCRRRCSTSGRWRWRSSSTSSGRCCSSRWPSSCAARAAAWWPSPWARWSPPRSCGRCGSRTPRRGPPSSPPRRGPGSSGSGPCSRSPSRDGRGRARPHEGRLPSAGPRWWALLAVALWLPTDIDWPGAWALLPTVPTAVLIWVGWQGSARGPVRVLGTAPMVWVGALSYSIYLWHWPVIILGGWVADAVRRHAPGLGGGPPRARLGRARVAVLAVRRVPDPPRVRGCATGRGPCSVRAWPCRASACSPPCPCSRSARPFTTTPPGGTLPPLSQLGAATARPGQPFVAGRRPRLGHPGPAGVGAGPAEGRRRPLPGRRRREPSPSPAPSATRRAPPRWPWSVTPRRCSGCRPSRRRPPPAAGGS